MPVERFGRGQRVVIAGTGEAFDGVAGTVVWYSNALPHLFALVRPDVWPEHWETPEACGGLVLVYREEVDPEPPCQERSVE